MNAAVSFEIGQPQGPARIAVTGIYRRGSDHIGFIADVKRLSILPLAGFVPEIPLAGIDLTLDGRLTGALSLDGALSTVGFEVSAEDGRIERPDVLSRALPVDTLEVKGATQRDLKEVVIDSFEVTSSGTSLEGSGRLVRSAAGAGLSAELRAENVPAADLDLYWPPELGEKARKWVLENITAGIAPHAEATLEFAPGELEERPVPEATVQGRFVFQDVTVGYFKTLPPLEGVDGSATFTARRMDIDVARGHVGNLEVSKGSAVITGMGIKGRDTTQLEVAAEIAGPIQEALALIDHEPLGFASKIGIEPQATAGRTEVDLRIGVPLHKDLEPSEVRVQAKAQLHDAAISKLRDRFDVDGGELELSVDRASAALSGSARVDGVPLEIDWQENLADDAALERSFHLQGDVPADALARFGIEPPLPVQGSFGLGARVEETAGRRQVYLALDLEPLAFSLPWLAWQKARGQEGRLDAVLAIPEE
ncbi:MAG: DUF3971 domain-containing protein, partial [Geminicoccales bacterium]